MDAAIANRANAYFFATRVAPALYLTTFEEALALFNASPSMNAAVEGKQQ